MDLIERYIYAVVKRLPEATRRDVAQELRANVQDMLPDGHSETDVRAVLAKLGNPYRLAEEYRETKRYLIGPSVYDSYINVLRLVTGTVATVVALLTLLGAVLAAPSAAEMLPNLVSIIWQTLAAIVDGAVQAALWVTVVFVILERAGLGMGEFSWSGNRWTLDDLPAVPRGNARQIPRVEAIFAMVGTVVGTAVFVAMPNLIGWYEQQDGRLVLAASLFDQAVLRSYVPAILLLAVTGILVAGFKLIVGRWNLALAVSNAIHNALVSILLVVASGNQQLFNHAFLVKAQTTFGVEAAKLTVAWSRVVWVFVGVAVVAAVFDSVAGFYKSLKASRG